MSRSLFVDVALKVTGAGDLKSASSDLQRTGLSSRTTQLALTGVAAGFGALSVGAAQAERAESDFMGATGRSREEAEQFRKSMDGLAGSAGAVGRPFSEIAAAGTEVARQFGLTGQANADLTEQFLEFSKVTKSDAVGSVKAIDDALAAFGKPASDATGFMDQLTASSQTFGTEVGPEAIDTLTKFAPALSAMGSSLDDGIGLLNLFESAGLDAAASNKAFTAAVQNIPPGENLQTVLARIQAIEDPAKRTAAAVEVFGNKGGQALALALRPGSQALSDYTITAEEAAGQTARTADAMLTTSDRFRQVADKAIAGVRELGASFGPVITSLGVILPAIGSVSGALFAQAGAAAAAAGGWGAVLLALTPFIAVAAAVAGGILVINEALNKIADASDHATAEVLKLDDANRQIVASTEVFGMSAQTWSEHAKNFLGLVAPWHQAATSAAELNDALAGTAAPAAAATAQLNTLEPASSAASHSLDFLGKSVGGLTVTFRNGIPTVSSAANSLGQALPDALEQGKQDAAAIAAETPGALASRLRSTRDNWKSALDLLKNDLSDSMKKGKEIAELEAALTGKAIQRGLASSDPIVRAQAQETVNEINDRLATLKGTATDAGRDAGNGLASGLESTQARWRGMVAGFGNIFGNALKLGSPAKEGPWSREGGPIEWMRRNARMMLDAFESELGGPVAVPGLRFAGAIAGGSQPVLAAASGGSSAPAAVTVNVYTGIGDPVRIGREVHEALRAYERASGPQG